MVRFKERYLLVNILYPQPANPSSSTKSSVPDLLVFNQPTADNLTPPALLRAIREQVASLFGGVGSGAVERGLQVKYLSPATSTFILRIARAHYRLVWAALTFMDRIPTRNGKPCVFRVVRVSGTIRKVEEDAVRRARHMILAAKKEMQNTRQSSDALDKLFGSESTEKPPLQSVGDEDSAHSEDGMDLG